MTVVTEAPAPGRPLDGVQLHVVDRLTVLDECRRWMGERRAGMLCADTESAGLSPERDPCRMIQVGDERHGWAFPADGWGGAACELLAGWTGDLGFFNSPYDWRVLHCQRGLDLSWARIHDAQLGGHLADSMKVNKLKPRAALDVDSRAMAGEQALKDGMTAQGWDWGTVPADWLPYSAYAALDPVLTSHLIRAYQPVTARHRYSYDLERAYARICANMMTAGMHIDVPYITSAISRIEAYVEGSMAWLTANFGLTTVNSNEQVGAVLNAAGIPTLAWTGEGKPAIDKDTLKLYRTMFPQHAELIDALTWCRKGDSVVNRYLRKFLALAGPDGVIHYSIHSTGAKFTGRSSVTDPPMQTYDRDMPVIRGGYVPDEGNVFVTIDADQIEARLIAHFSRDPAMIAEFRHCDELGLKFFVEMAGKIYGEPVAKTDPRYAWTKNATYAQLYGSGLETAARTAGVPVEQMRPAYMGLQQLYPRTRALMDRLIREARAMRRPGVQTLSGRWLYCYRGKEYALTDYLAQGSAAEILKQGVVSLDAVGLGPYLRLPVHDEIIMECRKEDAPEVLREAVRILTDRENFAVPLTWSGSILEERWKKA